MKRVSQDMMEYCGSAALSPPYAWQDGVDLRSLLSLLSWFQMRCHMMSLHSQWRCITTEKAPQRTTNLRFTEQHEEMCCVIECSDVWRFCSSEEPHSMMVVLWDSRSQQKLNHFVRTYLNSAASQCSASYMEHYVLYLDQTCCIQLVTYSLQNNTKYQFPNF